MTDSEIKRDIYDHLDQLKENAYPEDLLTELADSATPLYYGDIIQEWQEMPIEFNDSWQDLGVEENAPILRRMRIDLFLYYQDRYTEIHAEIMAEQEELENV